MTRRARRRTSGRGGARLGTRGATLLETVLAIAIMATAGLAIVAMLQKAAIVSLQAREKVTCSRLAQTGMARLKNIDYYSLFAVDSATTSANYGLHAAYPYLGVLNGIKTSLSASKFDRYRVEVAFMRRDTTDALGTGSTSNLIAFKNNGAGVDQYDPNIKYFDQNGDGDYYETYVQGGRTIAEQPDTHLKKVTFRVYRRGREACSATELISLEQFTGVANPDSESALTLEISTPSNNAYAYRLQTAAQISARALALTNAYPADVDQYRADAASPLPLSGLTEPLATVNVYVGGSGVLASASADVFGSFAAAPAAVTAALAEGQNLVSGRASKATFNSPIAERSVILDVAPPAVSGFLPAAGATANTYQPYVAATIADAAVSSAAAASGVCPSVLAMKVNGSTVNFVYNPAAGTVVWTDAATQSSPMVSTGTYVVSVEGGDFAGYKTSATWSFDVSVPATDNSAPAIANKSPIGMAGSDLPVISVRVFDNQSGVIPTSIVMTLDGVTVVNSANFGQYYDPSTGNVTFTPSSAFAPGSGHFVSISANHGATSPADKINSYDSWGFVVP